MLRIRGWVIATVVACVPGICAAAGCSGAPADRAVLATSSAAGGNAGVAPDPDQPAGWRARPERPRILWPVRIAAAVPRDAVDGSAGAGDTEHGARLGFALHRSGDLVAFDPRTGSELGRYVFGRDLEDVCWDARTGRVLIVEHDAYDDGSRVYALRWDGGGFVLESSSPVLPGHSRVWAARDRVYVVSEEQGVVWNVLDDDLAPAGAFEPLARPASLIDLDPAPQDRLLALDTTAHIAGHSADRLLEVAHPASGWSVREWSYLAPGRPSARMVAAPHTHTAFVLQKLTDEGTIELGTLSTQAPAAPDFHVVLTGAGRGSLQALVYDTEQRVVVAVLASTAAAKLALVPTTTGRAGALVPLDAPVPGSRWWSRVLVRDGKTGRIVVATQAGLRAFSPGGSQKAPALVAEAGFSAPDLRAPIALAE